MVSEYRDSEEYYNQRKDYFKLKYNHVYIFGHSLDVTDGDILRETIRTPGVITTVFYVSPDHRGTRIIYNPEAPDTCYLLFLMPRKDYMEESAYRDVRSYKVKSLLQ